MTLVPLDRCHLHLAQTLEWTSYPGLMHPLRELDIEADGIEVLILEKLLR